MALPDDAHSPLLSVVIPAYNEADSIRQGVLQEVVDFLASKDYTSELLVVDDGSEDETASLIEQGPTTITLIRNRHQGKAASVRKGVLAARGRYVIFMDMDLSTPIRYVDAALAALDRGADVVIASRHVKGGQRLGDPWPRRLAAKAFALLVRILLLPDVHDSQCGFKGFRRPVAQELFNGMQVFAQEEEVAGPRVTAFDVELLLLAKRRGYRIQEMPVTWRHVTSKRVRLLPESLRMLGELLQVWWKARRGKYNSASRDAS